MGTGAPGDISLSTIRGMDYSRILTTLRVNGLAETAPPEQIRALLTQARYSEEDIALFLSEHELRSQGAPIPVHRPLSASEYVPLPKQLTRKYKLPSFMRRILYLLVWVGIAAVIYVSYFIYVAPAGDTILNGLALSTEGTLYHTDFQMYAVIPAPEDRYIYQLTADTDTTNPSETKAAATSTILTSQLSGSTELRFLGETAYSKVNTLEVFGQPVNSASSTWYKVPVEDTGKLALQLLSPIDTRVLAGVGTTTIAQSVTTLFKERSLTLTERPHLELLGNKLVLVYILAANDALLTKGDSILPLQADSIAFGSILVTQDIVTRKVISIEATDMVATSMKDGEERTIHYAFRLAYSSEPNVSIEPPVHATLIEKPPEESNGDRAP